MGRSVFRRALPFGLVWLTFWVIILFIGLHSSLGNGHVLALLFIVGLGGGLIMALIMWLMDAGPVYLAHYRLRYLLWRSGVMPWNIVRFLDEATERVLLQSVGGGYRFIHPLFQQYFASLTIAAPSAGIQPLPPPHP